MTKIGFIGFGNMAQAIAQGLIATGYPASNLFACAKDCQKLADNCAKLGGVVACEDAPSVLQAAEMVILAVKPQQLEEVLSQLQQVISAKHIVVSLVLGFEQKRLAELLPQATSCICTMPNTPMAVGYGILIYETNHSLSAEQFTVFEQIFSRIALVEGVSSANFGIAGTIAGCSPAFVALINEALADAAVKYGLPRATAYRLVSQVLRGTGALQLKTNKHPGELKDAVCSPGGSTIKGVTELEKAGLRAALIAAIDAICGK